MAFVLAATPSTAMAAVAAAAAPTMADVLPYDSGARAPKSRSLADDGTMSPTKKIRVNKMSIIILKNPH